MPVYLYTGYSPYKCFGIRDEHLKEEILLKLHKVPLNGTERPSFRTSKSVERIDAAMKKELCLSNKLRLNKMTTLKSR